MLGPRIIRIVVFFFRFGAVGQRAHLDAVFFEHAVGFLHFADFRHDAHCEEHGDDAGDDRVKHIRNRLNENMRRGRAVGHVFRRRNLVDDEIPPRPDGQQLGHVNAQRSDDVGQRKPRLLNRVDERREGRTGGQRRDVVVNRGGPSVNPGSCENRLFVLAEMAGNKLRKGVGRAAALHRDDDAAAEEERHVHFDVFLIGETGQRVFHKAV